MKRLARTAAWIVALALLSYAPEARSAPAVDETPGEAVALPGPVELDRARALVEAKRYDRALTALRGVLADPGLEASHRVEALALRARVHEARRAPLAAEKDYREILRLRPSFGDEAAFASERARSRFRRVRESLVGDLRLELDPPDGELLVDGVAQPLPPDRVLALLAGAHTLRWSRNGFDPEEIALEVTAGKESELRLTLAPNARAVLVQTAQAGVTVRIDGVGVGTTSRPRGEDGVEIPSVAAELLVEGVELGERVVDLELPCHRPERLRIGLSADLLDRSPRRVGPADLAPLRATLALIGGPEGAIVELDGVKVGTLPIPPIERCPGPVDMAVRNASRRLWRERAELAADAVLEQVVAPRPNAALAGADEWPEWLRELGAATGAADRVPVPAGDPWHPEGWRGVSLAADVDLVIAKLPAAAGEAPERWILYSPPLGTMERLDASPPAAPPRWLRGRVGAWLADGARSGSARVMRVVPGGPGERAGLRVGDRVVGIGPVPIVRASEAVAAFAAAPRGSALTVRVEGLDGTARVVAVVPAEQVAPVELSERPGATALAAAWARVAAASGPPDEAAAAGANLAWLLGRAGRHRESAALWGELATRGSATWCAGAVAYERGVRLEAAGRRDEATAAFELAAASDCFAFAAPAAEVAPAARARLDRGDKATAR